MLPFLSHLLNIQLFSSGLITSFLKENKLTLHGGSFFASSVNLTAWTMLVALPEPALWFRSSCCQWSECQYHLQTYLFPWQTPTKIALSVRLQNISTTAERMFMKFDIREFYEKFSSNFSFHTNHKNLVFFSWLYLIEFLFLREGPTYQ